MADPADRGAGVEPVEHPDGAGELARRVAELDWAATPLGPRRDWPAGLSAAVRILLTSRFSMWMAWGPQLTMFYNDAYWRGTLRAKHPWALGRPAREVWAEIWDDIGPRIESVLTTGRATWDEDLLLFLERAGYPEETYHTFSYSPLADDGRVAGMLCVVTENTDRVLSERRMATLHDLAAALAPAHTEAEVLAAVRERLAANRHDVPFSLTYLFDDDGGAELACTSGVDAGAAAAPTTIDARGGARGWPVQGVRAGRTEVVEDLAARFADLPAGAWSRPPSVAVLTPLVGAPGEARPRGFLVVGLNPFRAFDERYRGFVELLAGQISSALVSASAYEAERRRAEALAELDRAKTEFFTGVSHEFRTPLTLIMGPIEQLRAAEHVDPERWRAELEVAHRNGLRMGRLVNTLLDFSRLQAGRMRARFVPTELAAVTAELAGMFRAAVERAGLELEVRIDEPGEPVWVDRDSWEKIVSNLLSNAVKFTFAGAIGVRLHRIGTAVALEVSDTGIGVPADELELLFDRFHQVRGARGRSAEGSGIGLALVRDLVGLHGGTVTATSRVGVGTTFTVRIPLGSAHLPADQLSEDAPSSPASGSSVTESFVAEALRWMEPSTAPAEPAEQADGRAAPPARLLIADDNADMREYLSRLLSDTYALQVVTDGAAALAAARTHPPDLVITDVMMPDLDGFALVAALRAEQATAGVPVIVLSARAGQDAVVEGLAAGADDYLVKPFSAAELLARVRSALALSRLRRREAAWRGALLSALQDGLFVVDGAGRVVQVNDGFAELLGYGHDGLPYPAPHPWWPDRDTDPEGHARIAASLAEVQATGRGRHLLAMRHRDGHRLWVETSAATVPDPERPDAPPMVIGLARDVTAAHRAAQRDRLLSDAGQLLSAPVGAAGGMRERLRDVVDLAAPVLDDIVVIARVGPDGFLHPIAASHPDRPELAAAMTATAPYRVPASLLDAYRRGRAVVLDPVPPAVLREVLGDDHDVRAHPGPSAAVVAPLTVQGRLAGLLIVACPGDHPRPRPLPRHGAAEAATDGPTGRFDRLDVELADELARRIAVALGAERVAEREHRLNTAATALAAAATVPQAAAALAAAVRDGMDASGIGIYVPQAENPTRLELVHHEGPPAQPAGRYAVLNLDDRTVTAEAARTGRPVWVGGPAQLRPHHPDGVAVDGDPVLAAAALPLRHADRTIGVLALAFPTPREFPADERSFAVTLAAQAAQAFERAALADARAQLADTLQRSLLPTAPPKLDDLALATRYLPGVAGVQAGGDWYDILALDRHRVAVVVGDVVGQGAPAAAVMGQLRAGLAAILTMLGPDADPAVALTRLNDYTARVPGARGSTAVCVVIDTEAGRIRWAGAGHPPPLLLGHDGTTAVLGTTGPLLGAFPSGAPGGLYRSATRDFAAGDTVLLYTDGLVERRGEVIDDGITRLADTARPLHRVDPEQLATTLLGELVPHGLGHDDIALVAARHLPPALRARHEARADELTGIRRDVDRWAGASGLHPDHVEDLQLALGEALANAVEHAYPDGAAGTVDYTLQLGTDRAVRATVTDHGRWRPPPADRGYRGRGVEVIRALGRDVTIDHAGPGPGTAVAFTLDPPPHDPAEPVAATPAPDHGSRPATLRVHREPGHLRLAVHDGIDLAGIDALREQLLHHIDTADPRTPLVLDLRATTYLPSAGIGLVLELLARARASRRSLTLDHDTTGPAARALALAGLAQQPATP
ncbi:SpoIIE family protein phosphatase [Pseudonocardia humida]|uniref:histidine kinase n=1 Tax=Pseudonocardia humida TaxID=2800819 RepID=A0ABT0ZV39_9PSEU|nr:SpoIIE family protein phosphatase [Pseudonocardia humida]MCO1654608.1 SpoIIE family protein phosphatase [Pseudonocardia humida]